jgi:hypothetical protein
LAAIVGENNESYGMRHTFTILRRVKNDWRVLFLTPNTQLPLLEELIESFDNAGFKAGEERFLPEVEIVGPTDNVSLPRYPEKPALQWKPLRKDIALYLVEFQFGQKKPNSWSNSWIEPVRQQAGQKSAISITAPFGVGAQPHRWRVWAIARDGNVSISEWRIINFSN